MRPSPSRRRRSSPSRSRARAACGRCRGSSRRRSSARASAPAHCSSPTKCSAASGAPANAFYFPALGLTPDLISVGKALGSGVPIGAALVAERVAAQIFAGDHGSTYGGNLLSTRAGLYVLEQLTGTTERGALSRRRRADRPRARDGAGLRARAQPPGRRARDRRARARGGRDARAGADGRRRAGRRRRAARRGCWSTARRRGWCGCCRR